MSAPTISTTGGRPVPVDMTVLPATGRCPSTPTACTTSSALLTAASATRAAASSGSAASGTATVTSTVTSRSPAFTTRNPSAARPGRQPLPHRPALSPGAVGRAVPSSRGLRYHRDQHRPAAGTRTAVRLPVMLGRWPAG